MNRSFALALSAICLINSTNFVLADTVIGKREISVSEQESREINAQQHQLFRGDEGYKNQSRWYRELRIDDWKEIGLTDEDLAVVLPRIQSKGYFRDESNPNISGHWTYEWRQQADMVAQAARETLQENLSAQLHQRAAALYLVASYPNLLTTHEQEALKEGLIHYIAASRASGEKVRVVQLPLSKNSGITGLLHLPKKAEEAAFPVVLWTGGIDKTLVEHQAALQPFVDNGIAVITFDIPGAGLNKQSRLQVGTEAQSHQAALNYVKQHTQLDASRVAVLTSSGGGISLVEFVLANPQLKAAVARCTLVDGVLSTPKMLPHLPRVTVDTFFTRLGADYSTLKNPGELTIPLSLKTKGYFDGQLHTSVPLLVINTHNDPVVSATDMLATAQLSRSGRVAFYGEQGHCPEGEAAEQHIQQFITKWL